MKYESGNKYVYLIKCFGNVWKKTSSHSLYEVQTENLPHKVTSEPITLIWKHFSPLQLWSHFFSDFRNTIPVESFYWKDWVTKLALQPKQTYKACSLCIYMYKTTHIPASIPQYYVTVYRAKLAYKEILRGYYFCHICTLLTNFKYKFHDRISSHFLLFCFMTRQKLPSKVYKQVKRKSKWVPHNISM